MTYTALPLLCFKGHVPLLSVIYLRGGFQCCSFSRNSIAKAFTQMTSNSFGSTFSFCNASVYMTDHIPVTSAAKPAAENAILVIDMQNDFVLPGAPLEVAGAYATLPAIGRFLDYGRAKGWAVIYVCRAHRASGADAELFRRHLFEEGRPFCVAGTEGAEVVAAIAPQQGDYTVAKLRFSAFFGTDLDILLRGLGVRNIFITGTQYPNCVRSTAVDSMSRDYLTVVVTDCCSAATESVAAANIADLRNMGIPCITSAEIMKGE